MKNKFVLFSKFLFAVFSCYLLASIAHSQFVLSALIDVGAEVSFADRLSMTLSDIKGLSLGYGSVILLALGLGFLIINGVSRWVTPLPGIRYPIAGFIAIGGALLAMHPLLNVTLIAVAREPMGFLMQCIAGLVGGLVFMQITKEA
jgi:hypothetical protein